MLRETVRDYAVMRGDYFIDDEGYLCFGNEEAYANYLAKQNKLPSEVKAYYLEGGVKVAGILGMSEDALLQEMTSRFLKEKITDSEQRIGKFYLKEQKLRQKYQMNL